MIATHIVGDSPADNGGLRKGDRLTGIESVAIRNSLDVPQVLMRIGSWKPAKYHFLRGGRPADANVIVGERHSSRIVYYQYFIGALDNVKIYNKALTAGEILHLFNTGTSGTKDLKGNDLKNLVLSLSPNPATDVLTVHDRTQICITTTFT